MNLSLAPRSLEMSLGTIHDVDEARMARGLPFRAVSTPPHTFSFSSRLSGTHSWTQAASYIHRSL